MDDKQFWRGWRHHGDKIGSLQAYALAFVDDLEPLDLEDLGREVDRLASQKMAAIYVDFVDGEVATPDMVAPMEASSLTARVREAVDHARQQLSRMSVDVIAAMEVMGPAMEALTKELLASGDHKQVLARFRQLLVDVPGMSAEELMSLLTPAAEDRDESRA